jgi:hypothetical protein
MALSGQRSFNPNLGEITIGAFARCGIRRTELTQQHMSDAQFEANLLQSDMQGDGIQLYEVTLEMQDLVPNQTVYPIDPNVVFMLDVYIRQNPVVNGVGWTNTNVNVEVWDNNNDNGSVWSNGSVPQPVVGGNSGTIDRLIMPISRSDYAAIANKYMTGFPTSYWMDYLLKPVMYLWPVPNQFVPLGLQYYVQKKPNDADLADGSQVQIPYQYYDYYVWSLAERLAYIYAPDKVAMISPRKQQSWLRAMQASTENVPLRLETDVASYFRVG